MLTKKQIAYLRSLAQKKSATMQIGKSGVTPDMITDCLNYLNKNELVKISILQNCPMEKEECAEAFVNAGCELVQIIGKTLILYKKSKNAKNPITFE